MIGHNALREKKLSKFYTSLVFVYKSISLKCFRIEQLCQSIDSMILLFSTLRYYVIVNLNVNENHVQYVHSKTDILRGPHSTKFESFLTVSTKTGKKIFENQCQTSFHVGLE